MADSVSLRTSSAVRGVKIGFTIFARKLSLFSSPILRGCFPGLFWGAFCRAYSLGVDLDPSSIQAYSLTSRKEIIGQCAIAQTSGWGRKSPDAHSFTVANLCSGPARQSRSYGKNSRLLQPSTLEGIDLLIFGRCPRVRLGNCPYNVFPDAETPFPFAERT